MTIMREWTRSTSLCCMLLLSFCVLLFLQGCGKKDAPKDEKPHASTESKEGAKDHEHEKEPDIVRLSPEQLKMGGIEVQKVVLEDATTPLTATAVIELNSDRASRIGARVSGRITRVTVSQGERVNAGQPLAFIDSVELDQAWAEYVKMKSRHELALGSFNRETRLFEQKVSPEKDVLKARQELREAEADLTLSRERFRLLGIDVRRIENQKENGSTDHPLIPVASYVAGTVIEKSVTQGEVVSPDKVLFTVADLSTLWVTMDVYEKDIARLKAGAAVTVSVASYPDKHFRGKISYLGDLLDEKTRTVKARVTIDNKGGLLKPGMFATVSIDSVKDARAEKVIAIPEEAVFLDGSERYVFVREGEGRFGVRRVSVGPATGAKIEIKEGLKEGDEVVTKGAFALKSELKKETLDAHEH